MRADTELNAINRPEERDYLAPEGGQSSPGCGTSLLDFQSVDPWEDGTLREDVGERWRPKDLDKFFTRMYEYFKERGYACIVMTRVLNTLALAFITFFSTFLLAFVNWHAVLDCTSEHCDHDNVLKQPFANVLHGDFYDLFVLCFTVVLTLFMVRECCVTFYDIKEFYLIKCFVNQKLGVTERDMRTILWPDVVDKIMSLQEQGVLIVKHKLTPLDISNRIMRKDNYFMAMINKECIDLRLPVLGKYKGPMLTKTMEWNLNHCIMSQIFDPHSFTVRARFIQDPGALKTRFILIGLANLILSPFIFTFMIIYFFFKHAQEMHKDPATAGTRTWSQLARWKIREFNELEHFFDKRINASFPPANKYVLQFPANDLAVVAKFIVFICGSFAGVLIVLSLIDESLLLYVKVFDRNLLWYIAIFGIITAVARPFVVDKHTIFDPDTVFMKVVKETHYYPKRWRNKVHTYDVYDEFTSLFPYKIAAFLQEVASIVLVPFWMMFVLPGQAEAIVRFIQDFTENLDDLGDVCAFASFDFELHGNSNYGAHVRRDTRYRSKQGKMEKSFLTFMENNPNYTPGPHGQALLNTLTSQKDLSSSMQMVQKKVESAASREAFYSSLHSSMEDLYTRNLEISMPGADLEANGTGADAPVQATVAENI